MKTTRYRSQGPDPVNAEMRRLAFRHGVSERKICELLSRHRRGATHRPYKTQNDVGKLANCDELSALDRVLAIGGATAWAKRVKHATGAEALFDQDFRFIAVSPAGRTLTTLDGKKTELPEIAFLGVAYKEFLPPSISLLNDGCPGFDGLQDKGFFDGRLLGVQIDLELNFGFHFLRGTMEVWAIHTPDRGVLGHSKIYATDDATPTVAAPGVAVHAISYL